MSFEIGSIVASTYGKGKVIDIRADGMLVINPTEWELANKCIPTFYIMKDPPANTPMVTLVSASSPSKSGLHVSFDNAPPNQFPSTEVENLPVEASLIDLTLVDEPEVWEKKADTFASAPEVAPNNGI